MRPASLVIIFIVMWLKGCVDQEARRGDPEARRLIDTTSATLAAATDYARAKAQEYRTGAEASWADVVQRADAATSGAKGYVMSRVEAVRSEAARIRGRVDEFVTSTTMAAGDLKEGGARAAGTIGTAWRKARSRF